MIEEELTQIRVFYRLYVCLDVVDEVSWYNQHHEQDDPVVQPEHQGISSSHPDQGIEADLNDSRKSGKPGGR